MSDRIRAFGVGVYPLDVALPLRHAAITPYLVAGGTLRWLAATPTARSAGW